jgi:uncharacterized tellurite resistance protein B-like protein
MTTVSDATGTSSDELAGGIRSALSHLETLDRKTEGYLKTLAFILNRVAGADRHICTEEIERMEQILVDHASLSLPEAVLAVEIARHCGGVADCGCAYEASRRLRSTLDDEQRYRVHEFLKSVAEADGRVRPSEAAEIRQIEAEIGLPSQI